MDVILVLLTLWFMDSSTEAQHRTNNRGGVFSIHSARGSPGPPGFSILPHLNRPTFPPRGSAGPRGFSMLPNLNRPPPPLPRPNIGHGLPIRISTTGNVPLTYNTRIEVPSNLNTGNSVPLMFNAGRYFPVYFNTGNNIFPQNRSTGNIMEVNNGNNFPARFNTVNTFPANQPNSQNFGNSFLSGLNNEVAVPLFNIGTSRPTQSIAERENPANANTKNSNLSNGIFKNENRIDFLDPTYNGNVDQGANRVFSYFGEQLTTEPPSTLFDNEADIAPTLESKGVSPSEGSRAGVPRDSVHFGSSKLLAGTVSGTTDPTVLKESGSVFDVSQMRAEELGNLAVLRGSNNFKTTNTNAQTFSSTSENQQFSQSFRNIPSLTNTGGDVTDQNYFLPKLSTSILPAFTPQSSQPPLSAIPPQHPLNPTTTFDLMGNMAGALHDPLMFFGLNEIMDLDVMDSAFFNAISNPISANAALQMRVKATPSMNLLTSSRSNANTSPFLLPPPSPVSSTSNILTHSPIRNNDQIPTPPNFLQVSQQRNMFTEQADNVFPPLFSQTPRSRNRSQNPFRVNWNPIMARPPIPPGVQFLSQTIPGMTENFLSRNVFPTQQSSWFDPTFGIALEDSHDPTVKKTKIHQGNVEGKIQPISVGKEASKPIRVRTMARAELQNPAYTNPSHDSSLQSFQFKILHRILNTKTSLMTMNLVEA
ncbi:hypothetical protein KP79_PYT17678 [Mizuhopecten yessoensis]|uniref:Uncharacterized protein n=1 Tax=Mizuhopecten yessoensis TaxID=6573 RepID=A0A210Q2A6_MIZYE|nr:hypothetical protein KP79_PYT17678 [Mizuhopecten yessoensis]